MKYYSEDTVKGLLEQMDSHFVKYLEKLPCIEIEEPHGRLGDLDSLFETIDSSAFWDSSDLSLIRDIVKYAPTVLEATEERNK